MRFFIPIGKVCLLFLSQWEMQLQHIFPFIYICHANVYISTRRFAHSTTVAWHSSKDTVEQHNFLLQGTFAYQHQFEKPAVMKFDIKMVILLCNLRFQRFGSGHKNIRRIKWPAAVLSSDCWVNVCIISPNILNWRHLMKNWYLSVYWKDKTNLWSLGTGRRQLMKF